MVTLFLVRAANLYLKHGGTIAFVLPRSIFTADQHDGLRRNQFSLVESATGSLQRDEIWDCESVAPLFKVPSCVLVGSKRDAPTAEDGQSTAIEGKVLSGELPRKNASLAEAEAALSVEDVEFKLNMVDKRSYWAIGKETTRKGSSYYKDKFYQGATIVPRSFWFVRIKPSTLGFNPNLPLLETDPRAIEEAKKPYKKVKMEHIVESQYLYATVLSTDLLPFGHLGYRLVVLPGRVDERFIP